MLLGDVHAAACGLLMKGLRPLHTFLKKDWEENRKRLRFSFREVKKVIPCRRLAIGTGMYSRSATG